MCSFYTFPFPVRSTAITIVIEYLSAAQLLDGIGFSNTVRPFVDSSHSRSPRGNETPGAETDNTGH